MRTWRVTVQRKDYYSSTHDVEAEDEDAARRSAGYLACSTTPSADDMDGQDWEVLETRELTAEELDPRDP